MGLNLFKCYLGFSTHYANEFSERLESRATAIDRAFRSGFLQMMSGMESLHDAVDAAVLGQPQGTGAALDRGLAQLAACSRELTTLAEALVETRSDLFEREGIDAADPLVAREPFFAAIDYEAFYRDLVAHGAALPQKVFWDDLVGRVRDGGARAGLRLLDRDLRELQSDLHGFMGEVQSLRRLPLAELADALHGSARSSMALAMGLTRVQAHFAYFAAICSRAHALYEQELSEGTTVVAAAG